MRRGIKVREREGGSCRRRGILKMGTELELELELELALELELELEMAGMGMARRHKTEGVPV